ncbi:DUF1624 domain-containing protein [Aquibium sp. ELW1220]|uniref:heparan-alpha-glucosaminide N-acetyltransferase n=1 Tax=Aquibium sp. ELW1220 TaxID=2976766 RepID=UPI0025AEEF19|nr:DUF1624 domain-containing protein [Aquibium sp. ELW1220]MDN2581602.1 DUF1624 domain-containing protein [Aquibium sp. ELW1220]
MTQPDPAMSAPVRHRRIEAIDLARGVALIAMAIYHFTWDLEFFRYVEAGTTTVGGWKLFARSIASSFLFLVGVSLFLAHARGVRWRGFGIRMAMVAGAALAISIATYVAMPDTFIFFGILHQIALASLLGLAFLRLPWAVVLVLAAGVIAAPAWLTSSAFDPAWWWWTGLSETRPRSNDFVPLFPWFGAVLAGMAAAMVAERSGLFDRLSRLTAPAWTAPLGFLGRHSLAFYLIHQPALIGCVFLFSQLVPPQVETPQVQFRQACERTCSAERDEEFCSFYCVCVLDALEGENLLDGLFSGRQNESERQTVAALAAICTDETERRPATGGNQ